jgi:hypothetical protein
MKADDYDYQADDLKKVVLPGGDEDEYEPQDDDLPVEEWSKRKKGAPPKFEGKSGTKTVFTAQIKLEVPLVDDNGNAMADKPYRICLPSGKVLCGQTDSKGVISEFIDEAGEIAIELEDGSELTVETA